MSKTKDGFVYLRDGVDWVEYRAECRQAWRCDIETTRPDRYPCFAIAVYLYDGRKYVDFIFLYDDEIDAMRMSDEGQV